MPLKSLYATAEEIPPGHEEFYAEKDGQYVLDVDDTAVFAREPLNALNAERKLRKQRDKENADLRKQLSERPEPGDDPSDPKKAAPDPAVIKRLRDEHAAQLAEARNEADAARKQLQQRDIRDELRKAALGAGVKENRLEYVLKVVGDRYTYEDGQFIFKDEAGADVADSASEFFGKRFRKELPDFYNATGVSGSGAPGSSRKAGGQRLTSEMIDRMSEDEINSRWDEVQAALSAGA